MLHHLKKSVVAAVGIAAVALALAAPAEAGVVTRNGQGYQNANQTSTNPVAIDALYGGARQKVITSSIPVGNPDSIGSVYNVGWVPTGAIIDPASLVYGTGIAGLTNVSCGVTANAQPANQQTGTWAANSTLFVSAQDWHTAASFSLVQNVSSSNYAKRLWELLGLSLDPGGNVQIQCSLGAATSATGTLVFMLRFYFP